MKLIILLFCICCLISYSCSENKQTDNADLTVLDLSKVYPEVKMDIHEIADVEYIPLETTDNSLLFRAAYYSLSDKYIVTEDCGTILFFDRKSGKYLWRFNRQGQGKEEYNGSIHLIVDFPKEECLIYDLHRCKIFAYDFHGKFIRSFLLKGIIKEFAMLALYNYDQDYLIGYNHYSTLNLEMKDTRPYYLISKRDGEVIPLNLEIKDRINSCLHKEIITSDDGKAIFVSSDIIGEMTPMLKNGNEMLVADYALDTLYCLKDKKIRPLAVQTPTVRQGNIPLIISPDIYTDTYLSFYAIKFEYIPSDPKRPLKEAPYLFWNRKTGEIFNYNLYDSNILVDKTCQPTSFNQNLDRNYTVGFLRAEFLVEQYEVDKLRGKLKEVAQNLKEDDNWVMVLYKFK